MDAVGSARSVIKCLSLLFGLLLLLEGSLAQMSCFTPRRTRGSCIRLSYCKPLYDLATNTPVPQDVISFLRQSKCGFSGTAPNVCCPNDGITGFENRESYNEEEPSNSNAIPNASICGKDSQNKIFGGSETEIDEYPWMALLEYTKPTGKGFHCGGSLVAERYVLTAAHCVSERAIPRNYRLTGVRLGEHNIETDVDCTDTGECAPPPVNIEIDSTIVHEGYNPRSPSHENDIALVRLSSKVTFTPHILPICMPVINDNIAKNTFNGYDLWVAGWGRTERNTDSKVKLKVQIPVQDLSVCTEKYRSQSVSLDQTQMCVGGRSREDSCRGDSGGPLMVQEESGNGNWYIVGVVSFGPTPCGQQGFPGVYTKIASFSNWLSKNIK